MKLFTISTRTIVVASICVAALTTCVAFIGWQYRANLTCDAIEIVGNRVTDDETLAERVAVVPGLKMYTIDIDSVRRRVEADPWIESATIRRAPTGTLVVRVLERTPVALVLASGMPDHYVDAAGYRIPPIAGVAFDVPVLHGRVGSYSTKTELRRIRDPSTREILTVLSKLDDRTIALVSEIVVDASGSVSVYTTPIPGRQSIPVILGADGFEEKLVRLSAFWEQVLLRKPGTVVRKIDLRYDNQILTT